MIVALAVFLPLGGCGSDSGDTGKTTASVGSTTVETGSLSKKEFTDQADAICRKSIGEARKEFVAFLKQHAPRGPQEDNTVVATELVETVVTPHYQEQIDQIVALGAPAGDEDAVAAFLNAQQEDLEAAESDPLGFVEGGSKFPKATEQATAYGLLVCGDSMVA